MLHTVGVQLCHLFGFIRFLFTETHRMLSVYIKVYCEKLITFYIADTPQINCASIILFYYIYIYTIYSVLYTLLYALRLRFSFLCLSLTCVIFFLCIFYEHLWRQPESKNFIVNDGFIVIVVHVTKEELTQWIGTHTSSGSAVKRHCSCCESEKDDGRERKAANNKRD